MKQFITLLLLVLSFGGNAQDNKTLFNTATKAYNDGNYEAATENYLKIIANGSHSAALYYNLGNTYYKLNQIAPSIYYYEKALLLKPNDTEILNNLAYAKNARVDAIEEMPKTGLSKIYQNIVGIMSFDQWGIIAITLILLFVITYIAFYFLKYANQKRIAFISSLCTLFLGIIALIFAYIEYTNFKADQPAIIFSKEVIVQSEPNNRSPETFRLHEGTKVNVLEKLNDWQKIQIADGKMGWLPITEIKLLKDF